MSQRKKTFRTNPGRRRASVLLPWLTSAAFGLAGCGDPPIDTNSPDPAGVMEGTVLYVGPRPSCEYDEQSGVPTAVHGRVILTLFEFDNTPPPEGSATSAVNLLAIPGKDVFPDLEQVCPPVGQAPDPADIITASVAFTWPELPLGTLAPVRYTVRGFYDHDESFNPFFDITQSPTAGDIAGAAVDNPQSPDPQPAPIHFGTEDEYPLGQLVGSVSVSLGRPVTTEPPVFYASGSLSLASTTPLKLAPSPLDTETRIFAAMSGPLLLNMYQDLATGVGLEFDQAQDAAGLEYDIGAGKAEYAWYVRGIDVDGVSGTDPHPVLGDVGIQHLFPMVALSRRMTELEVNAGIPTVSMLASVPQAMSAGHASYAENTVVFPQLEVALPAVAIMNTNPALGSVCQVPVFAPTSTWEAFFDSVADCQELPTGAYEITALNGVMGGTIVADAATPTGYRIDGGRYSSQTWTVPNALGAPEQFVAPDEAPEDCATGPCAVEQGASSAFVVVDADPNTYLSRRRGSTECAESEILFGGTFNPLPDPTWNNTDIQDIVDADPRFATADEVHAACCEPIAHLCDVPLCAVPEGQQVRGTPTTTTAIEVDGELREVPDCVPFLMPAACCPNAPPAN